MKKYLIKILNRSLSSTGHKLIKTENFKMLLDYKKEAEEFSFLQNFPENASNYIKYKNKSKAQLKQDLFVLLELNFKKNGFFVEFGATDGISLSNTWLLEKEFGWQGILAEPGKIWQQALRKNRSCQIEEKCIWSASGETLVFNEVELASLSTVEGFGKDDNHAKSRKMSNNYSVATLSLEDLLKKYNAPEVIDYLSVDTEGSELVILENFNFSQTLFRIITVEHNYTDIREPIYKLLTSKGYKRVFESYSQFDDWYVYDK